MPRWPLYAVGLAVLLVVALVTAWVAGGQSDSPTSGVDGARLGPTAGEDVAGYLDRVRVVSPGPPGPRPALVQFAAPLAAGAAVAALDGTGAVPVQVVFRVPLPRVQTALHRVTLTPSDTVTAAIDAAQGRAAFESRDQARTGTGRPAAIAAAEGRALAGPCACVLALVVRLDPVERPALAARPGVRAVEVAPAGSNVATLAVSPLLPEQVTVAGPVPDDGPV